MFEAKPRQTLLTMTGPDQQTVESAADVLSKANERITNARTNMNEQAELHWDGNKTALPLITGTAGERAIDISKLRDQTGLITLDSGYGNTGSCKSAVTFIDGEKGILRYRGIPIEQLAEQSTFLETAYLLIYENLPSHAELRRFSRPTPTRWPSCPQ
jgi:hypothetical protein